MTDFDLDPEDLDYVPLHTPKEPIGSVTTWKGGFEYKPCYECQRNLQPSLQFHFQLPRGRTRQGYICFSCSQKLSNPVYRNLSRSGLVFTPVGEFLERQAERVVSQKRLKKVSVEEAKWVPLDWQVQNGEVPIYPEVCFTRPNSVEQVAELVDSYTGETYPEEYLENVLLALSEGKRPPLMIKRGASGENLYLARSQTKEKKVGTN